MTESDINLINALQRVLKSVISNYDNELLISYVCN